MNGGLIFIAAVMMGLTNASNAVLLISLKELAYHNAVDKHFKYSPQAISTTSPKIMVQPQHRRDYSSNYRHACAIGHEGHFPRAAK